MENYIRKKNETKDLLEKTSDLRDIIFDDIKNYPEWGVNLFPPYANWMKCLEHIANETKQIKLQREIYYYLKNN